MGMFIFAGKLSALCLIELSLISPASIVFHMTAVAFNYVFFLLLLVLLSKTLIGQGCTSVFYKL